MRQPRLVKKKLGPAQLLPHILQLNLLKTFQLITVTASVVFSAECSACAFSVSMYFSGILSSGRCIVLFSSQFNSLQALTAGPHVDCKRACALFVLELQHSVASSDMGLAVCGRVCWHTPPYSDAPMLIALVWEEWRARRAALEDRARSQHDGKVHLTLHHHSDKR